jgi:VWFA-related protein
VVPRLFLVFALAIPLLGQTATDGAAAPVPSAPSIGRGTEAISQEPESPTLQTNVPLVLAPVTVTDRKGNIIDGLSVDDFVLTDDGKPQKIRMDTSDTVLAPISMVLLIQSSGISIPELNRIHSVGAMIKPIITGDRGQTAVLSYDSEVRLRQEFTSDTAKIESAIESTNGYSVKTARLVDAVIQGVDMLATRPENRRRVMLILGESRDRGSKAPLTEAIEKIQRAGVIVYFGTYSAQASAWTVKPENDPSLPDNNGNNVDFAAPIVELARLGKKNAADAFARASGGRHLSFTLYSALEAVISRTGQELHAQYLLSFVPAASNPSDKSSDVFHRIEVRIPSHPDAVIRVRAGYWPEK